MRLQDRYGMGKDFNLDKALNIVDKEYEKVRKQLCKLEMQRQKLLVKVGNQI